MRTVTPSAGLTLNLVDIQSSSVLICHKEAHKAQKKKLVVILKISDFYSFVLFVPFCGLTNSRQLFAYEHVDDTAPAEDGLHHDTSGAVVSHLADLRRSLAKGMRLERRQCSFGIFRWHDADDLA